MNEILTLVTFLALLFYTGIEMKFQLQMLQQKFLPKRPIQPLVKRRVFRHHIPFDRFVSIAAVVNQLPADIRTNRHDYSGLGKKRKRVTNQI